MFNLFKKKEPKFIIEHYPHTGKYTVRYDQGWLFSKGWFRTEWRTGIIRIEDFFDVVDFYDSPEEAQRSIKLFKEQKLKSGVKYYDEHGTKI